MKTKHLALALALLLVGCNGSNSATTPDSVDEINSGEVVPPSSNGGESNNSIEEPNSADSVEDPGSGDSIEDPDSGDSTDIGDLTFLTGGKINNALPEGWEFFKGTNEHSTLGYYANGGMKFQYTYDYIISDNFASHNHIEVNYTVLALNRKSNIENIGDNPYSFCVYGLNAQNEVVAANGVLRNEASVKGDFKVILEGPEISRVKFVYASSPYSESKDEYYNVNFGGITVYGNQNGSDDITATDPVNPDDSTGGGDSTDPIVPADKLATPTNLSLDLEYTLHWDRVDHATSYRVFVNKENYIAGTNSLDLFYFLEDGIINTIRVQAIGDGKDYADSEFAIITWADSEYEGITVNEEKSNIKDTLIDEETKTLTIPSNKLSQDESGATPDIVLTFDYDAINYSFTYEQSNTILYSEENGNELALTFKQPGTVTINIKKNGDKTAPFYYDHLTIVVEETQTASFAIGYYDVYFELVPIDKEMTLKNEQYAYIWLDIIVEETEHEAATWEIVSGTALYEDWQNESGAYYTPAYGVTGDVVISATYNGETMFITIHVN